MIELDEVQIVEASDENLEKIIFALVVQIKKSDTSSDGGWEGIPAVGIFDNKDECQHRKKEHDNPWNGMQMFVATGIG